MSDTIVPKKPRKADYKKLFLARLAHEGRPDAYEQMLREVMVEKGSTSRLSCQQEAMRRCGIKSPDEERKLAEERGELVETPVAVVTEDPKINERLIGSLGLPENAPVTADLEWVRRHPMMVMAKEKGLVDIRLSHITKAPHGPAPSVTAVSMLVYYASKPGELYKELIKVAKDQANSLQDAESDRGIAEIVQLIKEVKGS